MDLTNYFIKRDYTSRHSILINSIISKKNVIYQPFVYTFAEHLAHQYSCSHVIDLGCGCAGKLVKLHPKFKTIGVDLEEHTEYCRNHYSYGEWITWNLDEPGRIPISTDILRDAVVICADVIEHLLHPEHLVNNLKEFLDYAPVALLSTPDRDLIHGYDHIGPPTNPSHIREWNLRELCELLQASGLKVEFSGYTHNNNRDYKKTTSLIVLTNNQQLPIVKAPDDFRVVTFLPVYNEEDVLEATLKHLIEQGSEVYVIDDWSVDASAEIAQSYLGRGVIKVDRYPPEESWGEYRRLDQLRYIEKLCQEIKADWFILCDADEIRQSPWPEVNLKDALYHVDQCGFNCVDHMVLTFRPVNDLPKNTAYHHHMIYYELGRNPGFFTQRKVWKNFGQTISLTGFLGHDVQFDDRKVYPYKFLLRHYPIRSQLQGEKKVFVERNPRIGAETREKGFSTHYSQIHDAYDFLYNHQHLEVFAQKSFNEKYLVERLSSVGIKPYPFPLPAKEVPGEWLEEMRKHSQNQTAPDQNKMIADAQKKISELDSQLRAIYSTKGWQFLNHWWKIKRQLMSIFRK